MLVFFLAPFLILLRIAASDAALAIPPFAPQLDWSSGWPDLLALLGGLDLENFALLRRDALYGEAALSSARIAATATALCLLAGYPIALALARAPERLRPILLTLTILPFWTSLLIRIYSWIGVLRGEGLLQQLLAGLGLVDGPLTVLNTPIAVYTGVVYAYLPFMILPIYASLRRIEPELIEAAADLGCSRLETFRLVVLPLSLPGVAAGCLLVFAPVLGEVVIPNLMGGSDTLMIGKTLWDEFFLNRDWPLAAALALALLALVLAPLILFVRRSLPAERGAGERRGAP